MTTWIFYAGEVVTGRNRCGLLSLFPAMTNQPCWIRDGSNRLVQGRVISISATRAIIGLAADLPLGKTCEIYFTHDFKVGRRARLLSQSSDNVEVLFEGPATRPAPGKDIVEV